MSQSHRAEIAKVIICAAGVSNVIILTLGAPTALTLSVAVLLAPFTLATALQLTVFVACSVLSYALSDNRDRAELLVHALAVLLPRSAGENYLEAMSAEIRTAPSHQVRPIALNLISTAPRTILDAWVRLPRPLWRRWRQGARR
ncbi:MAG: hypothetical protein ACRDRA_18100 [Pseudonocardiaceae bacterium]